MIAIRGAPAALIEEIARPGQPRAVREFLIDGPRGCVAGETELWDPILGRSVRIDELWWRGVRPWVQTLEGPVRAGVPFLKGFAPLYRVTLACGVQTVATSHHRFAARDDSGCEAWTCLADLAPGMELLAARDVGARRLTRIALGSRSGCRRAVRCDGGRLRAWSALGQGARTSRVGARARIRVDSLRDVGGDGAGRSRACRLVARLSTQGFDRQHASSEHVGSSASRSSARCVVDRSREPWRRGELLRLAPYDPERTQAPTLNRTRVQSCGPLELAWDTITSIEYERTDFYFDLYVPGAEHYVGDGIVSHNTGKTLGIGFLFKWFAHEYPGARMLFVRKAKNTITQAFCPDFERIVLADEPEVYQGQKADHRQEYSWPNGSILAIRGLDDPGKIYSTSWDLIVPDECAQLTAKEYIEFLATLRQWTRGVHAQYLIALTNPRGPRHWLILRALAKKMTRLRSFLRDNPKWHDGKNWTTEGAAYVGALRELPGVLYSRNYEGEWTAAEGLVWPTYDDDVHIVGERLKPPLVHVAAMDWGHTDPCAFGVAAIDRDQNVQLVREIYRREMPIEWWTSEVLTAQRETPLSSFVVDPSRPELIEHFNIALARIGASRLVKGANNRKASSPTGDISGIDIVRQWFFKRKLTFLAGRMRHYPDPALAAISKPCSTTEEIPEWAYWRPKDVEEGTFESRDKVVDEDNHGCFAVGTPIWTGRGEVPIESVRVGDRVATPHGWRRVLGAARTRRSANLWELRTVGGRSVLGTPNHKVWTDRGFTRIDTLRYGDTIAAWQSSKRSSGVDSSGVDTPNRSEVRIETTSDAGVAWVASSPTTGCTKTYIERSTARFLTACASTTSTGTVRTTRPRTWRFSVRPSTLRSIERTWSWLAMRPVRGTRATLAERGIVSTRERSDLGDSSSARPIARRVASVSCAVVGGLVSAATTASRPTDAHLASMTRRASASSADPGSAAIATSGRDVVLDRVLWSRPAGRSADVYDLTIEGEHVYFAGGVLVSNCDMLRYLGTEIWERAMAAMPAHDPKLNPLDLDDMRGLGWI